MPARQEQVPEAGGFCLGFQLLHEGHRLPAVAAFDLALVGLLIGVDVLVHEGADLLLQRLYLVGIGEFHAAYSLGPG